MPRPELPPILLSEVREAGLTVSVSCPLPHCRRRVEILASAIPLPGALTLNQVGHRMRCTGCGRHGGISLHPEPRGWVRYLRRTGQRERLPWYAAMMRDETKA